MKIHSSFIGLSIVFVCLYQQAGAEIIPLQGVIEISGGTSPVGPKPWLTATFDDHNGQGLVDLTLANTNLTANEFASEWCLNLDPTLIPGNLTFTQTGKIGSFDDPGIGLNANAYNADGDGSYDIQFGFATSDGASTRFGAGESVTYQITGISTLTAQSFNYYSDDNQPNKRYLMAAHVQSIGSDGSGSGWVATPEPSSFVLIFLGLFGLALWSRRQRI